MARGIGVDNVYTGAREHVCLVLSAAARLSDPCQARFVLLTKPGTFSWQEVRRFSTPCMLCTTAILFVLSLPLLLNLFAAPVVFLFPVPAYQISLLYLESGPARWAPGTSVDCKTLCPKGRNWIRGSDRGLSRMVNAFVFPWPHPAMSHFSLPSFLVGLQRARPVQCTWQSVIYALIIRQRLTAYAQVIFRPEACHSCSKTVHPANN